MTVELQPIERNCYLTKLQLQYIFVPSGRGVLMNTSLEAIRPEGLIEARHELTAKENDIIDLVLNTIKDDNEYVYEIDIEKYKGIYNLGSANHILI